MKRLAIGWQFIANQPQHNHHTAEAKVVPTISVTSTGINTKATRTTHQPEWRNWQTRKVEGLVIFTDRAGSSPVSGT